MSQLQAKDIILGKIRQGLNRTDEDKYSEEVRSNDYFIKAINQTMVSQFSNENLLLGVQVCHCENDIEFIELFNNIIAENDWKSMVCPCPDLKNKIGSYVFNDRNDRDFLEAVITKCEFLVAQTGTVVMSSRQLSGRILPVYSPVHIIVGYESQMVNSISEAFEGVRCKYSDEYPSALYFLTGVSSTGDIEKTLVKGVHGPKEVYIFLIEDNL